MNPEVKKMWVEALRSGDYEQGKGTLRNEDNQFCCLGVLCDIAADDGYGYWVRREMTEFDNEYNPVGKKLEEGWVYLDKKVGGYEGGSLPQGVREWAGLEDNDPQLGAWDAISWNDGEGASFEKIADLIEEHL